ncbi:hypothetical protein E3C22_08750 [Jiella endophytica]|uniref:Uncharacterized protein n=1 Tax=Jiella endophytica TaxID=2558362 RepID=A0A4Y8RP51_9HYPH|nr:hypothetical protein [Jiella endophytica]TFF25432.1 hypothetical protein E3C22_08750 [Jiella endophytica]
MSMIIELSDDEARRMADPILRERLKEFGYRGVTVSSEEDFDGDVVLRMTVDVDRQVSGRAMLDVGGEVWGALLDRGDRRFALLTYRRPEPAPGSVAPAGDFGSNDDR